MAHVNRDSPYSIAVAPLLFQRPEGPNTIESTIIHELSHFSNIGNTADTAYGAGNDRRLAVMYGAAAANNADNYGLFVAAAGV
jgi:hypothetical protein